MSEGAPDVIARPVRIPVELGPPGTGRGRYEVIVGAGVQGELSGLLPPGAGRAAVVTQARVRRHWDVSTGLDQRVFEIGDGEEAKSFATIEELCRGFTQFGLTRADVVVAVGGGVVTDAAGFAAAVYHRGVAVVHVATTLLGQVDAAIGGKTGVNLPEGKNLVGAFWQPRGVLCDVDMLSTLDPYEMRNGLGEMAKYYFLGVDVVGAEEPGPMVERVAACVQAKVDHVVGDERDSGGRRNLLNYGHTLGHALETSGRYRLGHGEAVSVGIMFAAFLARRLGRIDDARVGIHHDVLERCGLPTGLPPDVDIAELVALMARDKKALSGLTFILDGSAGLEAVAGVDTATVALVLGEMGR